MLNWILCPFRDRWDLTEAAATDALAQTVPDLRLLLIDQGSSEETKAAYTRWLKSGVGPAVSLWRHQPPMLSLSATWNRALQMVWDSGGAQALVINNDLRMWRGTYAYLQEVQQQSAAYFVTATGVTGEQYEAWLRAPAALSGNAPSYPLPGPDFSCYLITKEGHTKYPFDEAYQPAYCEDLDMHRRYMLGGDGARIFGTGLPYYHVGSGTLKGMDADKRMRLEQQISQGSRAYHRQKWGGPANQETFAVPFGPLGVSGIETPVLFERVRNGLDPL